MITFIVLSYNHQNYICSCLNSIKHQIVNYGKNYQFQLIIGDDCSTDSTVDNISQWIEENQSLFHDVDFIARTKNIGTCSNYKDTLSKARGSLVKAIAGDDMLPPNNIVEIMELLNEYDIVYGVPFSYQEVNNDENVNLKEYISDYCYEKGNANLSFNKRISRNCFLNAPSTYIKKELLMHPQVLEYMENYKYLDDYSQWVTFTKIRNIKSLFVDEYTIIYRRTNNSAYIIKNLELKQEKLQIYRYVKKESVDLISKLYQINNIILTHLNRSIFDKYLNYENYKLIFYKWKYSYVININKIKNSITQMMDFIHQMDVQYEVKEKQIKKRVIDKNIR